MTSFLTQTITASTMAVAPLPSIFLFGVNLIVKVHRFKRGYQRVRMHMDPENWSSLCVGEGVNFLVNQNSIVKIAAQIGLIALLVDKIIHQQKEISQIFFNFGHEIKGTFPSFSKGIILKEITHIKFSVSSKEKAIAFLNKIYQKILNIWFYFKEICSSALKLSEQYIDIYDLATFDSWAQYDAIKKLMTSTDNVFKRLIADEVFLREKLNENKELVNRLLTLAGFNYRASDLTESIAITMKVKERFENIVEKGKFIIEDAAKSIFVYNKIVDFDPLGCIASDLDNPLYSKNYMKKGLIAATTSILHPKSLPFWRGARLKKISKKKLEKNCVSKAKESINFVNTLNKEQKTNHFSFLLPLELLKNKIYKFFN